MLSHTEEDPNEGAVSTTAIVNVWTLSSRANEEIAKEVKGESTELPTPALRTLFRGDRR